MPTGPEHAHVTNSIVDGALTQDYVTCRCMIGEDHVDGPESVDEVVDEQDDDDEEGVGSFAGAEEIWLSSGMDEDYDFR